MELERFRITSRIIEVLIGSTAIAVITLFVNHSYQQRQLELSEMEMLGKFVEHAMDDDLGKRQRFAEYFAVMTTSPDVSKKWVYYRDSIVGLEIAIVEERIKRLHSDLQNETDLEKREGIKNEIVDLKKEIKGNLKYSRIVQKELEQTKRR